MRKQTTMKKLFHDILRDKGAVKYSITKFLALLFSGFLIIYLSYAMIATKEVDHTLVIELLGVIGALVGLKNNWGVGGKNKDNNGSSTPQNALGDMIIETKINDTKDDAVF